MFLLLSVIYVSRHGRFGWEGCRSRHGNDQASTVTVISDGHGTMRRLHRGGDQRCGAVFASVWVFRAAGVWFIACVGIVRWIGQHWMLNVSRWQGGSIHSATQLYAFFHDELAWIHSGGLSCFWCGLVLWTQGNLVIGGKFGRCSFSQLLN